MGNTPERRSVTAPPFIRATRHMKHLVKKSNIVKIEGCQSFSIYSLSLDSKKGVAGNYSL